MAKNALVTDLSPRQTSFVEALLAGGNLSVAARTAGVHYSTAQRWQKDCRVQTAIKAGQQALFEASLDELMALFPKALETLTKHLEASVEPTAATQLQAARSLIEAAINIHKLDAIEEGLAALERRLDDADRRG